MADLKQRVQRFLSKGDIPQAIRLLEKACKGNPGDSKTWRLLGGCQAQNNDFPKAEYCFRKALECNSQEPESHIAIAGLLVKRRAWSDAANHLNRALHLRPGQPLVLNDLGYCLQRMRLPDEAVETYQRSLSLDPHQPLVNRNLALLYEQLHQLDNARRYAESALEQASDDIESNILLAKLDARENHKEQAITRLQALLKLRLKPFHLAAVNLEMGKIYDKCGNSVKAFSHLAAGKQGFRKVYGITPESTAAYRRNIDRFREVFVSDQTQAVNAPPPEAAQLKLIFLVGFPRSGTTLTEQILEAHSRVQATHELPVLVDLSNSIDRIIGRPFRYPEDVASLTPTEIKRLRKVYLENMQKGLHAEVGRDNLLLDKLPLNIVHLGLVERLFPEARVLVALRDPRDVCLSCYLQTFEVNPAMAQFLDLQDTADFYTSVMKLWLHYKGTLGLPFLETSYEAIVDDFEQSARRILDFIGLDWDSAVLSFYEKARQRRVYTPSYAAVTKPVYKHSAGKWKAYAEQLAPVLPVLEPMLRELGY